MAKTLAAIDCGTNSTRLLIVEQTGQREYKTLHREAQITRLGEGTDRTQELGTEAMDRVLATLIDFAGKIKDHDVSEIKFVATSAVRDARNRDIFLMAAEEVTVNVLKDGVSDILIVLFRGVTPVKIKLSNAIFGPAVNVND